MKTILNIALIGPGLVGKEFLNQIKLFSNCSLSLRVIGITSSKSMKLASPGTDLSFDEASSVTANIDKFIAHANANLPCVVVDCTSNDQIAALYPALLEKLHLVTPNKKGFSGSAELYDNIAKASLKNGTFVFHESTVGAGLPILSTLNDLIMSGDEIIKIEGIFSGTLSYIFNLYSQAGKPPTVSFSDIVKQAKELGYTEPDPRDDLNGMDVARKVVILGRLSGKNLSTDTLAIENIVPAALRNAPDANAFLSQLSSHDSHFADLNTKALAEDSVLRYVGVVDPTGTSSVSLRKYSASHPFASLKGSDNIIAFTTKRFPSPLIIQGSGAGSEVTAFGMFSDILKIARAIRGTPL